MDYFAGDYPEISWLQEIMNSPRGVGGEGQCSKKQPTTDLCSHKIVDYLVITIMYLYTNLTERSR